MGKAGRPKGRLDSNQVIYALYHGDVFIDIGSRHELAKLIHCTPETITFYASPSYKKRIKDYTRAFIAIALD